MQVTIKKTVRKILPKTMMEALVYLKHSRSRLPNHEVYAAYVAGKKKGLK